MAINVGAKERALANVPNNSHPKIAMSMISGIIDFSRCF